MVVLDHSYQANKSLVKLKKFKGEIDLKGYPEIHVGSIIDLMRMVSMELKRKQEKELKCIMYHYYQVFITVSYGSTLGANAEALMGQMLHKESNKIVDLLISVHLFES